MWESSKYEITCKTIIKQSGRILKKYWWELVLFQPQPSPLVVKIFTFIIEYTVQIVNNLAVCMC